MRPSARLCAIISPWASSLARPVSTTRSQWRMNASDCSRGLFTHSDVSPLTDPRSLFYLTGYPVRFRQAIEQTLA